MAARGFSVVIQTLNSNFPFQVGYLQVFVVVQECSLSRTLAATSVATATVSNTQHEIHKYRRNWFSVCKSQLFTL